MFEFCQRKGEGGKGYCGVKDRMARMLLMALACAAAAYGARSSDYSGARIPHYGTGDYDVTRDRVAVGDEYRDHSPDAPASLDYKYEEDSNGKTTNEEEVDESDTWSKAVSKHKRPLRPVDNVVQNNPDEHTEGSDSKFKSNDNILKRKRRPKNINEILRRRSMPYEEKRNVNINDNDDKNDDFIVTRDDFQGDKSIDFEDNESDFVRRKSNKVVKRKPRDRSRLERDELYKEEEEWDRKNNVERHNFVHNYNNRGKRPRPKELRGRHRSTTPDDDDEYDADPRLQGKSQKKENYDEYSDYYDMKRVHSIKKKLPMLLRRTKARMQSPTRSFFYLDAARRFNEEQKLESMSEETTISTTSVITHTTSSGTVVSTITQQITNNSLDLSLAEKSRLSILKKAQKKENLKAETTTKPPVLLQMTKKMRTVVMVEPPVNQEPWQRAREVSDDTPERLDKVKRLMRHKLVSNAKNIRDLTDNWDDMICDYVDVALLDSAARSVSNDLLLFSVLNVIVFIFRLN